MDWFIALPVFETDEVMYEIVNSTEYATSFVVNENRILIEPELQAQMKKVDGCPNFDTDRVTLQLRLESNFLGEITQDIFIPIEGRFASNTPTQDATGPLTVGSINMTQAEAYKNQIGE